MFQFLSKVNLDIHVYRRYFHPSAFSYEAKYHYQCKETLFDYNLCLWASVLEKATLIWIYQYTLYYRVKNMLIKQSSRDLE